MGRPSGDVPDSISVAPAGSYRSGCGGDNAAEAAGARGRPERLSDQTGRGKKRLVCVYRVVL